MRYQVTKYCSIRDSVIKLNGKEAYTGVPAENFDDFIKGTFRTLDIRYPKFFKMDRLSKLGFLTAELLLTASDVLEKYSPEELAVVIANKASSLDTDRAHYQSIIDKENYFPSPSVFVYTLPNILIGEICIRHKIKGENAFFIFEEFNTAFMADYVQDLLGMGRAKAAVVGWVELDGGSYESFLCSVEPPDEGDAESVDFNAGSLHTLYSNN